MRRRIFVIPLLWLLVLIPLNSCQPGDDEKGGQPNPLDQAENITMGEEVLLSFPELPYALKNQASVSFPDASTGTVDSMLALMQKDPGLRLLVTGLYDAREDMPEGQEDLGIMRAIFIKRFLADRGMDTLRVDVATRMDDMDFDEDGKLSDGYRFRFLKDTIASVSRMERTVYFWAAEDLIRWDPELKGYCDTAAEYMLSHPGIMMVLTGHTDYNGNHLLGEMRAESLKDYFGRFGLDTARVIIRSEGPDKPVAPNDTQENKSKNRRVEVSFVQK